MADKPKLSADEAKQIVDDWNSLFSDKEVMAAAQAKGISPDQLKEVFRNAAKTKLEGYEIPEEHHDILEHVLSAIDYGAGLVRTPSMMAAAAISGRRGREAVSKNWRQDLADAFTINDGRPAPSTGEWMKRMGIEKGKDLNTKLLQIPWNTLMYPKALFGAGKSTPAPGPDIYDAVQFVGDAGLSPGGLGLVQKGAKTMAPAVTNGGLKDMFSKEGMAELKALLQKAVGRGGKATPDSAAWETFFDKVGRVLKGKGPVPNQDLYGMTAKEARSALEAANNPTFTQKYVTPTVKFAADPLAFTIPRAADKMYKGVFSEADRLSKAAGHGEVTPYLADQGITGSPGTVYDAAQKYGEDLARSVGDFRDQVQKYSVPFDLERTRKGIRRPMNDFFMQKAGQYGQSATQSAKDAVWDAWEEMKPGKKVLDFEDLNDVKRGFQGRAREANAYKDRPRIQTGNPKMGVDEAREAELIGDSYREQGRLVREAEEDLYDEFSRKFNDQYGIDMTPAGSNYALTNRKLGALMSSEPALLQRYRYGPTQNAFGGGLDRFIQEFIKNPTDAARTAIGLYGSRYGQLGGMGARAGALETYGPRNRKSNPWKLMDINLSGAGDTSYDQ